MENIGEILITVAKGHELIQFDFPDGNLLQLPKNALVSVSDFFRILCVNETENQFVAVNEFSASQAAELKHFLVCVANGFASILKDLPMDDALKILKFDSMLKFTPEVLQSVVCSLADLDYNLIRTLYSQYWTYKYIDFPVMEKVAKREKNLIVILHWLDETSWTPPIFFASAEFSQCKALLENFPEIFLPATTSDLLDLLSNFSLSTYLIDAKKLLNSLPHCEIVPSLYSNK